MGVSGRGREQVGRELSWEGKRGRWGGEKEGVEE